MIRSDGESETPRVSRRMSRVQSPIIPVVGELIRGHPGTISLGQGVVHYGPPPQAITGIEAFLKGADNHKYKLVSGIPELLAAISMKLKEENSIAVGAGNRIIVTAGGNMAFVNALLTVADEGDEVIIQHPYYFNHEMAITMAGCVPVSVATRGDGQLDVQGIAVAVTGRTRAIVTVSPNNPTGAVYREADLRAVSALCKERGLFHIHDEAYEYFVHGEEAKHFSPASLPDAEAHTISLFSLSKSYGMASWRIGYMVVPAALEMAVKKVQDTNLICAPVISQYAAVGALSAGAGWCRPKIAEISRVRELVLEELSGLGACGTVPRAEGAFYVLLSLDTKLGDMAVVERLVREFGVAVVPGQTFGITQQCRLRVAYGALERETVAEGIGRLVRGLRVIVR
jgi:aspartate/methionine/tyrosine aminotransferase